MKNKKKLIKDFDTMGHYLIENYNKDYILKLARNKKLLEKQTPRIYEETKNNIKTKNQLFS